MVEMFCHHGARASAEHLHQAVWRRRPASTLVALLDAGAPVDTPDHHGLTPLQIATRWGDEEAAALLHARGADPRAVTDEDRALGAAMAGAPGDAPAGGTPTLLDEMLILAIQGGHLEAMRALLAAGARVDGDPESDDVPLGQACWRGRAQMARELVALGAALSFPDGGSAIGAALHGSRHCQQPEGGPSMATFNEIPREPYAEIVRMLLAAGAAVPERFREAAELGVDPPA